MGEVADAWVPPTREELTDPNRDFHYSIFTVHQQGGIKFDEARQRAVLDALENGHTRGSAAKVAGTGYSTVYRFAKCIPEYEEAMRAAEMTSNAEVETALFRAATEDRDVRAQLAWLYSRWKERWRDQRYVGVEGTVKHEIDSGDLNERLEELSRRLELTDGSDVEVIDVEVDDEGDEDGVPSRVDRDPDAGAGGS